MTEVLQPQFVICVRNSGAEDLELRKLYQVVPDEEAARDGYLRVIDESGEDYLYPAEFFVAVELPATATAALLAS
ncbi:MAG: hypothetical protein KIS91_08080 [Anaerolineae bacterium]|nr:hypothetical protein [Anaerolineae bacterium]